MTLRDSSSQVAPDAQRPLLRWASSLFGTAKNTAGAPKQPAAKADRMNVQTIARPTPKVNMVITASDDRVSDWLKGKIEQGLTGPFAEVVTITPTLAMELLARNEANRPLSAINLQRLISDLEAGRWELNGESIIVSRDGKLNDGQNRLTAILESGRSARSVLVFGIQRAARLTTDVGVARTVGHFLGMQGHKEANVTATVAQYVWMYRNFGSIAMIGNTIGERRRPTKAEILGVADSFPDIQVNVNLARKDDCAGRSVSAFCRWAISRRAGDAAAAVFFEALRSGAGLSTKSPILMARNRLLEPNRRERLTANERAGLIFRAWNAYRAGSVISKLVVGSTAVLPKLEA